jgi:uncharacterized repeat protein (TIGR01451 family)
LARSDIVSVRRRDGMERIGKSFAAFLLAALLLAPMTAAHAEGGADLTTSMRWLGTGASRAAVGQTATYAVTVTNLGSEAATGVQLIGYGSDQFNTESVSVIDATISSGQSVTGTVVLRVCCFPQGESRAAFGVATVSSTTLDPNIDNNTATVNTKIIGPHN